MKTTKSFIFKSVRLTVICIAFILIFYCLLKNSVWWIYALGLSAVIIVYAISNTILLVRHIKARGK